MCVCVFIYEYGYGGCRSVHNLTTLSHNKPTQSPGHPGAGAAPGRGQRPERPPPRAGLRLQPGEHEVRELILCMCLYVCEYVCVPMTHDTYTYINTPPSLPIHTTNQQPQARNARPQRHVRLGQHRAAAGTPRAGSDAVRILCGHPIPLHAHCGNSTDIDSSDTHTHIYIPQPASRS